MSADPAQGARIDLEKLPTGLSIQRMGASWSFGVSGVAEDNPSHHTGYSTSRLRPDAKLPICCTLPKGCPFAGFGVLSQACPSCLITSPMHAVGAFPRVCGCCCSLQPIVEAYTAGLDRPATTFLSDDGKSSRGAEGGGLRCD